MAGEMELLKFPFFLHEIEWKGLTDVDLLVGVLSGPELTKSSVSHYLKLTVFLRDPPTALSNVFINRRKGRRR